MQRKAKIKRCNLILKMDVNVVSFMKSKFFNETLAIYRSARKPGLVYKFALQRGKTCRCCRCLELNKQRSVTIKDTRITGRKHPEDDHHPDCEPAAEAVVCSQQIDRTMRSEVNS